MIQLTTYMYCFCAIVSDAVTAAATAAPCHVTHQIYILQVNHDKNEKYKPFFFFFSLKRKETKEKMAIG